MKIQMVAKLTLGTLLTSIVACGGGGGGSSSASSCDTSVTGGAPVALAGSVRYAHVKHNTSSSGLDYTNVSNDPVRGATVEFRNCSNAVLASTTTDDMGAYTMNVPSDLQVQLVVRAEALKTTGASRWDLKIRNPSNNATHAVAFPLFDSASGSVNNDFVLKSGWVGNNMGSYAQTREAGAFAILDSMYGAMKAMEAVDASVNFPALTVFWNAGYNNGTSFYDGTAVHILGDQDTDTDEYDGHVVVHEWGHYFEDQLSRSDSIGGQHSGGERLDMRLALGEGFGNALAGIVTGDQFYRDSLGARQQGGFAIDTENNDTAGWYDENTTMGIIHDLGDTTNEAGDPVAGGMDTLYNAMTSNAYREQTSQTSIFSLINHVKINSPGLVGSINTMTDARGMNGSNVDDFATQEMNNAGDANDVLPVYTQLTVNGAAMTACTTTSHGGSPNKLSYRRFFRFTTNSAANTTITINRTAGTNTIYVLYNRANVVDNDGTTATTRNIVLNSLAAGEYVLDVRDSAITARSCFSVSVSQ